MLEYIQKCSDMFRYVWLCSGLFGYFQICSNVSELILTYLTYPTVSKHIKMYLNISESVRAYPNIFECIHTCLNAPKRILQKNLKVNYVEILKIQNRFFMYITLIFFLHHTLFYNQYVISSLNLYSKIYCDLHPIWNGARLPMTIDSSYLG